MKIKVVEFYPTQKDGKKKYTFGTLHVYLEDIGIHMRGIEVRYKKDKIRIKIPYRHILDPETEKKIGYPIISLNEVEETKMLIEEIRKVGFEYIKQKYNLENVSLDSIFKEEND